MDSKIYVKESNNVIIFKVENEFDNLLCIKYKSKVTELIARSRAELVVFDLNNVTFLDSSGIGLILGRYKQVKEYKGELIICGVNKNIKKTLAISGIANIIDTYEEIFENIIKVYCFDAPGISETIKNIEEAKRRFKKIIGYTPQTAIIGRLFAHYEKDIVVSSTNKGLYQHDLLSWEVEVNKFKRLKERDQDSLHIEQKIDKMLLQMSPVLKEEFVEIGYGLFMRTQSLTLTDLSNKKTQIIKQYMNTKKEERRILEKTLSELILDKVFIRNILFVIRETFAKTKEKKKYIKDNEIKK